MPAINLSVWEETGFLNHPKLLPWVQLDVQETYITTANFLRLWQKHELGFIECLTLEETQGQYAPTTPVYAILKTAIFILTDQKSVKDKNRPIFL